MRKPMQDLPRTESRRNVSFEEFKLYFATTDRVTERRDALNRFNYSVSAAVLVAIAALANLAGSKETFRLIAVVLILIITAMAYLFSTYWVAQIDDLKQLNSAKFRVLEDMAKDVVFDESDPTSPAVSFEPFKKEWEYLQAQQALINLTRSRSGALVVLRASKAEYFVPRSFRLVFIALFMLAIAVILINWNQITRYPSPFSNLPSPNPSISVPSTPSTPTAHPS